MIKFIKIKFLKIKYGGDSIGNDIRAKIELLGKFLHVDKTIKVGATAEINKEVGSYEIDRKLFEADVRVSVIEKDLLFNDVGSADGSIKIDTSSANSQQFVYKVQVKETRSILGKTWSKAAAVFEITLEADVEDAIRYVSDEGDGWIKAKFENGDVASLPAYLKVKVERVYNKREYFTILEGAYRGKLASVKLKGDGSSNLISSVQHGPAVLVTYSIAQKILTLNGKTYTATDYKGALWKKGLYDSGILVTGIFMLADIRLVV